MFVCQCVFVCVLCHFWPFLASVFAVGILEKILMIWGPKYGHFCQFYWPFLVSVFAVCIFVIYNMCQFSSTPPATVWWQG